MEALKALALDKYQRCCYHNGVNRCCNFIYIWRKKKVSPWMFLDFVSLLRFILGDRFFKIEVERGNTQRWEEIDEKRTTVDLGQV